MEAEEVVVEEVEVGEEVVKEEDSHHKDLQPNKDNNPFPKRPM